MSRATAGAGLFEYYLVDLPVRTSLSSVSGIRYYISMVACVDRSMINVRSYVNKTISVS